MKKKKPKQDTIVKLIIEELSEFGVEADSLNITVEKGPKVVVEGDIFSKEDRNIIRQVIEDVTGADDIVDDLVLIQSEYDSEEIEASSKEQNDQLEDDDYEGTEDVFESIEDGVPYIPPTDPAMRRKEKGASKKKKKRS